MSDPSEYQSLPTPIQRAAAGFRTAGWTGFWVQVVLAVVATIILLFAASSRSIAPAVASPGRGFGVFFAICGLVALYVSIFWAFRYTRLSKQLQTPDPALRPRKADTVELLRMGVMINLIGLLLIILGAQAIVGTLLAKSLSQVQGLGALDPSRQIQPLDIFVVQANTHTITAHFAGLVTSLWLLNRLSR